jgi:hypothetical protein
MKLFKFEGYKLQISEEALALKPFKVLWNRDKSSAKTKAIVELSYIYFMEDPRSDYQYLIDREDRDKAIKEGEGLDLNWKPDDKVQEAMKFYASFKSTSALLLEDTRAVIDNVRKSLREFSFEDMDDKDRVNAIKSVASTIATIPKLIKDLDEAEKAVNSEMRDMGGKVKGQKSKSLLEDSLDI